MTLSWSPVVWVEVLGSITVLGLAALCTIQAWSKLKNREDQSFYQYIFLLTLIFVLFAVSRSFSHLVKQGLFFYGHHNIYAKIAPFCGAINTATFIVIFSFGIYFYRSQRIHTELERHKWHLTELVGERTRKLSKINLQLSQEISDRTRTEQRLEKTIAEFSAVMEAIDYGVLFMDADLRARIVNRAFRDIWGVPEGFVDKRPTFRELMQFNRYNKLYEVKDEEFEGYMDRREASIRQGAIAPTELKRRDGKTLQYQCVVLPDNWRMLTYFDITELKNTQEKLAQSQRMEAIGLMAGGVAHDLNNILSGVVSYPDFLLMKLPRDSELRQPLTVIKESGQRAAEVVADLLTVARDMASNRETCSLNTLVMEYLQSPEGMNLRSLYPEIRINTDLDPRLFNIACSPVHIKKCLMNLLTNAAEAIASSGTIQVKTWNQYIDKPVSENQSTRPGDYAVIRIQDNGKGICNSDLNHIFEPFYTKKTMGRSGTGLGLAIVWNTVQEHGGAISVSSSKDGTRFELYFPTTEHDISANREEREMEELQGHGELILVIDDEEQQRNIATQMLTLLNYRTATASSGREALTFIQNQAVDLVILDMIMDSDMGGRQTYEKIVALRPGQKAIIVSGFSENEEVEKTLRLGAGGFIRKPYTMEELALALKSILTE